jgi:hypothetical protein
MNKREKAFQKKTEELIKKVDRLTDREVDKALGLLEQLRKEVESTVVTSEWKAHRVSSMKESIQEAVQKFEQQYRVNQSEALANAWLSGEDMITVPLQVAGVDVAPQAVSRTSLEVLQGYSADLIESLSKDALKKVNTEISLGVMGGKQPHEVMGAIGRNLKDKGVFGSIKGRAEAITRTEMARVHSMAGKATQDRLVESNPDKPWMKKWLHSGKPHARQNHLALDGVMVPVDEDFPGGLPYPHAPGLPAKEVVNCGCSHVVTLGEWESDSEYAPGAAQEQAIYD